MNELSAPRFPKTPNDPVTAAGSAISGGQTPQEVELLNKQAFNYTVLLRHDPRLAHIFFTSPICNIYKFKVETSEWEKTHYQGTLFIYQRNPIVDSPRLAERYPFALKVMNRLDSENFTLGLMPTNIVTPGMNKMNVSLEDTFIMVL
ncbi:PH domain-like protein, partial [Nadsonia fulvescens var. elongata DSM 6958]